MSHPLWSNEVVDHVINEHLDDSLSGLCIEIDNNTNFNMTDTLLALPFFDLEQKQFIYQYQQPNEQTINIVLSAPTSPAMKVDEDSLTYLNQGQPYEIKFQYIGNDKSAKFFKSFVKITFHDRRLQYCEDKQISLWQIEHPTERILEVDTPLSRGIIEAKNLPNKINMIEISWDPFKTASVYVKIKCISTEFTPKKHGGEKGVPFRLQVDTYSLEEGNFQLIFTAFCQVKIFKPKGADRKHKTDREKFEKQLVHEKHKYQPSCPFTVLMPTLSDHEFSHSHQMFGNHENTPPNSGENSAETNLNQEFHILPHTSNCFSDKLEPATTKNMLVTQCSNVNQRNLIPKQDIPCSSNRLFMKTVVNANKTSSTLYQNDNTKVMSEKRRDIADDLSHNEDEDDIVQRSKYNMKVLNKKRNFESTPLTLMNSNLLERENFKFNASSAFNAGKPSNSNDLAHFYTEGSYPINHEHFTPSINNALANYKQPSHQNKSGFVFHSSIDLMSTTMLAAATSNLITPFPNNDLNKESCQPQGSRQSLEDEYVDNLNNKNGGSSSLNSDSSGNLRLKLSSTSNILRPLNEPNCSTSCFEDFSDIINVVSCDESLKKTLQSGTTRDQPILQPDFLDSSNHMESENGTFTQSTLSMGMTEGGTVINWLAVNGFNRSDLMDHFHDFTLRDMMRLSRADLIDICGLPQGIRLNNALHKAPIRPRMTLYFELLQIALREDPNNHGHLANHTNCVEKEDSHFGNWHHSQQTKNHVFSELDLKNIVFRPIFLHNITTIELTEQLEIHFAPLFERDPLNDVPSPNHIIHLIKRDVNQESGISSIKEPNFFKDVNGYDAAAVTQIFSDNQSSTYPTPYITILLTDSYLRNLPNESKFLISLNDTDRLSNISNNKRRDKSNIIQLYHIT